jgi:cyanophycinase
MLRTIIAALAIASQAMAQGYICAEGGGNAGKGQWADEVFGWMVEKGNHGKVVLLGAVAIEQDERPALFTRLGAGSVESLVVTQENADTQEIYDKIAAASVVFIRGGAQDRYVRFWKGTKTQRAIVDVYKKGGVVAGTSAGCAVLGEVVYDAIHGSLTAREALADGRHEHLSLTTDFLNLVPGVLFDTHFTERGRLARLPVMLAHCKEDLKRDDILGIGVDPRTAVCIGPDGIAEIRGEGTVTCLRLMPDSRVVIEKGKPPAVSRVSYSQYSAGYRLGLAKQEVLARPPAIAPRGKAAPPRPPTIDVAIDYDGGSVDNPGIVRWEITTPDAWLNDGIRIVDGGRDVLRDIVVGEVGSVDAAHSDHSGARLPDEIAAVQLALVHRPALVGVWLPRQAGILARPDATINVRTDGLAPSSIMILSGRSIGYAGRGASPRRAPVIEGAMFHALPAGWTLDLNTGEACAPTAPTSPPSPAAPAR